MKSKKILICTVSVLLCAALILSSCGTSSHAEASATTVTAESVSQTVPTALPAFEFHLLLLQSPYHAHLLLQPLCSHSVTTDLSEMQYP